MNTAFYAEISISLGGYEKWSELVKMQTSAILRHWKNDDCLKKLEHVLLTCVKLRGTVPCKKFYENKSTDAIDAIIEFLEPKIQDHFLHHRVPNEIDVGLCSEYLPQHLVFGHNKLCKPDKPIICTADKHLVVGLYQLEQAKKHAAKDIVVLYLPPLDDLNALKKLKAEDEFCWPIKLTPFQRMLVARFVERTLKKHTPSKLHDMSLFREIAVFFADLSVRTYERLEFIYQHGSRELLLAVDKREITFYAAECMIKQHAIYC